MTQGPQVRDLLMGRVGEVVYANAEGAGVMFTEGHVEFVSGAELATRRFVVRLPGEPEPMPWVEDDGGRQAAGFRGRTEDCVTRAIAIAVELPYREVYDAMAAGLRMNAAMTKRARKGRSPSPRDGVPRAVYGPYLLGLGWTWHPTMSIGSGTVVHLRVGELPAGRLVVRTSRHIVAVVDGVVHDTADPTREGTRAVYGYYAKEGQTA